MVGTAGCMRAAQLVENVASVGASRTALLPRTSLAVSKTVPSSAHGIGISATVHKWLEATESLTGRRWKVI